MALGLYKPGQGYWVRVMTAALAAVLVLAACGWVWAQVRLVPIPVRAWTLTVSPATGTAAAGQTIGLIDQNGSGIGTAEVISSEPSGASVNLRVRNVRMAGSALVTAAERVGPPPVIPGAPPPVGGPTIQGRVAAKVSEPIVQPLYVQAVVVLMVMLAGTAMIYWLVGVKPRTAEFLIATDGEMRKVNWSTRKGIIDSTWVVILWSVLLAAGLFIVDFAFSQVFTLIGVLQRE